MALYSTYLTTSWGERILNTDGSNPLSRMRSFTANRTVNRIAGFKMVLPASIDRDLIRDDNMVQIWRSPSNYGAKLFRPYFIRKRRTYFDQGMEVVEISGPDCNDILRRRVVATRPGTTVSEKVATIDDMMKEIVLEAFSDGVNPAPDYGTRESEYLSIDRDRSEGPMAQLKFPWEKLLTPGGGGILAKLAETSEAAGTPIYFDVVPYGVSASRIEYMFVTYSGQPGVDRGSDVIFSMTKENLENPEKIEDAVEEENYIYATGQGEDVDQKVEQVYDEDRVAHSVWGRIEGHADAASQDDDEVIYVARSELADRRSKTVFFGDALSTPRSAFQIDWDFGDRLIAEYHGRFTSIVKSVELSLSDGFETISARLEGEMYG